jgi:SAM-dependent methyltransferase
MFARIRDSWSEMGAVRPHHSVLTTDEFRPERFESSRQRFWDSGELEAKIVAAALAGHGFRNAAGKTCVEYGCGVGRLTLPFAARFGQVHAYDLSRPHLQLAEQRAAGAGLANIQFHCCADGPPKHLERCDFLYSRLVLQHNRPPLIRYLLGLALGALKSGGIAIFGLPTYLEGYCFRTEEYLQKRRSTSAEMHCLPQSEVFALIAAAHCSVIEVREEHDVGRSGERLSNIFVVERRSTDERLTARARV